MRTERRRGDSRPPLSLVRPTIAAERMAMLNRILSVAALAVFGAICGYAAGFAITFGAAFIELAGPERDEEPMEGWLLFLVIVVGLTLLGAVSGGVFAWRRTRHGGES
jgi:hypothetical protein